MGVKGISSYDYNNFDTSILLSAEALEMYRQMLPKNQYRTEYLGEFLDSDSSVFNEFKSCIDETRDNYNELYVGIDWGSGNGLDDTAVVAINEFGEEIILEYFNNKSTQQQIDYIYELLKSYLPKIKKIYAEKNGIGGPLTDLLTTKFGNECKVDEWVTTNDSKSRLVAGLQVAFEQKQITIKNDEKQIAELSMYEATYNLKTNKVTYNGASGVNDDIVMALMIAWECKKSYSHYGEYSFVFI